MHTTTRFGVSMDNELLAQLDALSEQQGFSSRSDAIRHLVRQELLSVSSDPLEPVVAYLTLSYRAGTRLPANPLPHSAATALSLQILANLQLHAEEGICLKILVLKGPLAELQRWSQRLLSRKGVVGRLTLAVSADLLPVLKR